MNEGHASLLILELLRERNTEEESGWDFEGVRRSCVFTTHTPVAAGHEHFSTFTIGFARRATQYKRMDLIFSQVERLRRIAREAGKMQFVFAGKAHPKDWQGKDLIKRIFGVSRQLQDDVKVVFLENYDIDIAKMLISGVDLWLNTPRRPMEASGTSGMKAVHNGVPNLSVLDGWWIEGHIEGVTGWSIGTELGESESDEKEACEMYDKLEQIILPMYYREKDRWRSWLKVCWESTYRWKSLKCSGEMTV
jgi:starch phosphorylase